MSPLVVALNPSVDVEWRVEQVQWEEKNQVLSERRWAGGKGINVARWLKLLGGGPRLLLPLGGLTGDEMARWLQNEGIPTTIVPLHEATRANLIVSTRSGGQLRFNPAGPAVAASEWRKLVDCLKSELARSGVCVLSGSLARGLPESSYAKLIRLAHRAGVTTLLDCDGPALAAAVEARPFLVKPNVHELARWSGRGLASPAAMGRAARQLSTATGGWVFLSLGADGGVLINARERFERRACVPRGKVLNTVGAGDALLAAVAWRMERHDPPEGWLRWGVAAGTAATQCAAGRLPSVRLIRRTLAAVSVR